jgi:hypothetical protein
LKSLEELNQLSGSSTCGPPDEGGFYQWVITWSFSRVP